MTATRMLLVAALAMIVFAAGYALCMTMDPLPATVTIPLQQRDGNLDEYDVESIRRKVNEYLQGMNESGIAVSGEGDLEALEAVYRVLVEDPQMLADPDLGATAAAVSAVLVTHYKSEGLAGRARRLCLELRWSPVRINRFAQDCRSVLEASDVEDAEPPIKRLQRSVVITDPPRPLATTVAAYNRNPYDGDLLYQLAEKLLEAGRHDLSDLLYEELLQIDLIAAARLQSASARFKGIDHAGHEFEFEE